MGCGMFITRHPQVLSPGVSRYRRLHAVQRSRSLDPYLNSVQWSRRFLGLRLFLSLAAAGWDGYGQHVERAVRVIGAIERALRAHDWQIANHSELAVLCVVPPPGSLAPRDIARRVLASGRAWVAVTSFEGLEVLRICATHGEITRLRMSRFSSTPWSRRDSLLGDRVVAGGKSYSFLHNPLQ